MSRLPKHITPSPGPLETVFSMEDQHAFAALSGDFNPMHIDPVAARRFMYGEVVVHGIHILLRSLDALVARDPTIRALAAVDVEFRSPVKLDIPVCVTIETTGSNAAALTATADGTLAMRATVAWTSDAPHGRAPAALPVRPAEGPVVLGRNDMHELAGCVDLQLEPDAFARLFPSLPVETFAYDAAVLLASTNIVGMRCPGYHSIFSQLRLEFGAGRNGADALDYRLSDFDERFSMSSVALKGSGVDGSIKAFLRPEPQQQPDISDVAPHVVNDEFAGRRALVVGGSRGLGEICAKILAAGGADVAVTYRNGADDARRVADEIRAFGRRAEVLRYDAGGDLAELRAFIADWQPTDLLYYATPAIKKTDTLFYNDEYFQRFAGVYVRGFCELIDATLGTAPLERIVYPSSVAVEELTKGMMEYSAAKAAGEVICQYISKRHPDIRLAMPRLPRMATDQTVSVLTGADDAAIDFFVTLLRANETAEDDHG